MANEYDYIYYKDLDSKVNDLAFRLVFIPASSTSYSTNSPTMVEFPDYIFKTEGLDADGGFEDSAIHGMQQTSSLKVSIELSGFDMTTVDAVAGRIDWSVVRQQIVNGVHCNASGVPELVTIGDTDVYLPNVWYLLSNNGLGGTPSIDWFLGCQDKRPETSYSLQYKRKQMTIDIELLSCHRWLLENCTIESMVNVSKSVTDVFDVIYNYNNEILGNTVNYKLHKIDGVSNYYQSMNEILEAIESNTTVFADKLFRLHSSHGFYNDSGIKFGYQSPLNNLRIYKQDETLYNAQSTELSDLATASNPANDDVKFITKIKRGTFDIGGMFDENSENGLYDECRNAYDYLKYISEQNVIKGTMQSYTISYNLPVKPKIYFTKVLESTLVETTIDVDDIIGDVELKQGYNIISSAVSNRVDVGEERDEERDIGDVEKVEAVNTGILSEKAYEVKMIMQSCPTTYADRYSSIGSSNPLDADFGIFVQARQIVRNMYYERDGDSKFIHPSLKRVHDAVELYLSDTISVTHDDTMRPVGSLLPASADGRRYYLPNNESNPPIAREDNIAVSWFIDYINWVNNVQTYSGLAYVNTQALLFLYGHRNQYLISMDIPLTTANMRSIGDKFNIDFDGLLPTAPEWNSQHTYYAGDNINYDGIRYICLNDAVLSSTTPDIDTTNWSSTANWLNQPFNSTKLILANINSVDFKNGTINCDFYSIYERTI